jgi:hypothetical protein
MDHLKKIRQVIVPKSEIKNLKKEAVITGLKQNACHKLIEYIVTMIITILIFIFTLEI